MFNCKIHLDVDYFNSHFAAKKRENMARISDHNIDPCTDDLNDPRNVCFELPFFKVALFCFVSSVTCFCLDVTCIKMSQFAYVQCDQIGAKFRHMCEHFLNWGTIFLAKSKKKSS
jgi:hypothetical protein